MKNIFQMLLNQIVIRLRFYELTNSSQNLRFIEYFLWARNYKYFTCINSFNPNKNIKQQMRHEGLK